MSRQLFASVIALVAVLSTVNILDAQLIRRRGSDCGCQASSQQKIQVSGTNDRQPNFQQTFRDNSQANYGAATTRGNYVPARATPAGYYQQSRMLRLQPTSAQRQQYVLVPQTQLRPTMPIQYSPVRGCWVQAPVQNPMVQYVLVPRLPSIGSEAPAVTDSYRVAPPNVPSKIQSTTFETPIDQSPQPLAVPEVNAVTDTIPAMDPPATSVLDNGS